MGVQYNEDVDTRNRVKELQRIVAELTTRVEKLESEANSPQCTHCTNQTPHLRSGDVRNSYAF